MTPVTDPNLLSQLEGPRPVTDQALLAQLEREPDTTTDVAKSAVTGVAKGTIDLATLPRSVFDLGYGAGRWVSRKLGLGPQQTLSGQITGQQPQATPVYDAMSLLSGPTTQQVRGSIEGITGKFHKPETVAGEYAQTFGEFLPAAAAGPGGIARRVAVQAAAPALISETAGQASKGSAAEPFARVGGALLAPAAIGGAGRIAKVLTADKSAPSLASLRSSADDLYRTADEAGVIVSKDSLKNVVDDVRRSIAEAGVDKTLHPKALAAFQRLEQGAGENQSLKGLDILRRVAGGAAQSIDRDEARIARIIRDKLDDYVERLTAKDVLAGDASVATKALTEARETWSRLRKGETIERLMERAKNRAQQFSGSGYENALRTEFRSLAQNDKRLARFSKDEQEAIRRVAQGGTLENSLRMLGKFAPRGVVSTALSGGTGFAFGGPVGSALMLGAGELGRFGATALTKKNARLASEMVRRGGPAPQVKTSEESRLARLLAGGVLTQPAFSSYPRD